MPGESRWRFARKLPLGPFLDLLGHSRDNFGRRKIHQRKFSFANKIKDILGNAESDEKLSHVSIRGLPGKTASPDNGVTVDEISFDAEKRKRVLPTFRGTLVFALRAKIVSLFSRLKSALLNLIQSVLVSTGRPSNNNLHIPLAPTATFSKHLVCLQTAGQPIKIPG